MLGFISFLSQLSESWYPFSSTFRPMLMFKILFLDLGSQIYLRGPLPSWICSYQLQFISPYAPGVN